MSGLVENLEKALQGVVDGLQGEIEALEDQVVLQDNLIGALRDEASGHHALQDDFDRLVLAVVDHVERGLIDSDELLQIALRGGV